MHDKPGGLCTSWKRKGYTIDGCIHWLVGTTSQRHARFLGGGGTYPGKKMHRHGSIHSLRMFRREGLTFYCDINRLEKADPFSPGDEDQIRKFIRV